VDGRQEGQFVGREALGRHGRYPLGSRSPYRFGRAVCPVPRPPE
jgi:hypothetical protein